MKPLALALCLLCSVPALGAEPVDLKAGEPAPYAGGLCDAECVRAIVAKRQACELERDALSKALTEAPPKPVPLGVWTVGGVALVVGLVLGVLVAR